MTPEADKIVPMIAAAGPSGMNRKQLGSAIDLERPVLDGLLAGFVQAGLLTFGRENGVPVFRTQSGEK